MTDSIEWLAGLMEGEGYFGTSGEKPSRISLRTSLCMNDEDIVRRAHEYLGR